MYKIINDYTKEYATCHTKEQAAELIAEWEREEGWKCTAAHGYVRYKDLLGIKGTTQKPYNHVTGYRVTDMNDLTKSTLFPQLELS